VQELRSQLDAKKKRSDELEEELDDREKEVADLRRNLSGRDKELEQLRSELSELKQKLDAANKDLPDATDVKQELARTSDLSDKAAKVVSFFRPLLNKKAPSNLLSKVEEILEES
jgi:chromosome segregation ATPase